MRYNPFNPQTPARPSFFVGREPEISTFERYLSQTIHGSPMNMSISGNRGMGKTSILLKFEQIARDQKCLTTRLSNYEGNVETITELADFISNNLKREILAREPLGPQRDKFMKWVASITPTISVGDVSLTLERDAIIQDLFRDRLLGLWRQMKDDFETCVLLIDEGESIERIKGALAFLREVFQRISDDAKYMVVLAGKLSFPEKMSESFSPLNRFFPCSVLAPFTRAEAGAYVMGQLKSVGVGIEEDALAYLCDQSEGHPYVLVAMCFMVFDGLEDHESEIQMDAVKRTEEKIRGRLAQDFFMPMYHPLKTKAKQIIQAIARNSPSVEFSFRDTVKWTGLKKNQISPYIYEVVQKGIVNKVGWGKYRFFHGLYKEFLNNLPLTSTN